MTDFQRIIKRLVERGWSHTRISAKCGCARGTISMLATGKNAEPKYGLGVQLVELERRTRPRK